MQPAFVSAAKIAATLTPALRATDGVIRITGIGDHLRPEWLITITGMRSLGSRPVFRGSDARNRRRSYVELSAAENALRDPTTRREMSFGLCKIGHTPVKRLRLNCVCENYEMSSHATLCA